MIFLLVLLFVVLIVFGYLFFAPFYIELNSIKSFYGMRFHKIASINLKMINEKFKIEVCVFVFTRRFDLIHTKKGSSKTFDLGKNQIENKVSYKLIKAVIKSFKVNKCEVSIDTGDMPLNGILYPLFYLMKVRSQKNIQINFTGETLIVLEIENSLARMSWAYLNS
jgi:hypothetical protein